MEQELAKGRFGLWAPDPRLSEITQLALRNDLNLLKLKEGGVLWWRTPTGIVLTGTWSHKGNYPEDFLVFSLDDLENDLLVDIGTSRIDGKEYYGLSIQFEGDTLRSTHIYEETWMGE